LDEGLGRSQMLNHVEDQHVVDVGKIDSRQTLVEVVPDERVQLDAGCEREPIDAGDTTAAPPQHDAQVAAGAAKIENTGAVGNLFQRDAVRTEVAEFWLIVRVLGRGWLAVEPPIVKQAELLRACHQYGLR